MYEVKDMFDQDEKVVDLTELYAPEEAPPQEFLEECLGYWSGRKAFHETIYKTIGNTEYEIETACDGSEGFTDKIHRMFFSGRM